MTPAVDVIVDRDDDIATVRTIHRLVTSHPTILAVSIAPDSRAAAAVVWAILRALGKRTEKLGGHTPRWSDAEVWLRAHEIGEVVVLHAEHLADTRERELCELGGRAGITVTFVYSGSDAAFRQPTITLDELIARRRPVCRADPAPAPWPRVPRSPPLRLRYDCVWSLPPEEFYRVDQLLFDACQALTRWLAVHPRAPRAQLAKAAAVVRSGQDANQRYIRHCATAIALLGASIHRLPPQPPLRARSLDSVEIEEALTYTSPPHAGFRLAEQLTGLPPDLLQLVGGDQITYDSLLDLPVPSSSRPVLRALSSANRAVLEPPPGHTHAAQSDMPHDRLEAALTYDRFAGIMARLIGGRRECIPAARLSRSIRGRLRELQASKIVEFDADVYRVSTIALYSSYQLPAPPPQPLRFMATEPLPARENPAAKHPGRIPAINPDFR